MVAASMLGMFGVGVLVLFGQGLLFEVQQRDKYLGSPGLVGYSLVGFVLLAAAMLGISIVKYFRARWSIGILVWVVLTQLILTPLVLLFASGFPAY